ncbi:HYR domain-containing protein, partial [Salinihabitans flavidus]
DSAPDTVEITVSAPADVEPPVISGISDTEVDTDEGVNTASVVLTATVTDNTGEVIAPVFTVDGTVIGSPHDFPVGATIVTVTAQDSSGNNAEPQLFTVTVRDTTPPDEPVVSAPTVMSDGKVSVSGIAEPGSKVTVTFPDGSSQTVTADPVTGAFTVTSATPQPSGDIVVMAVDSAGYKSSGASLAFVGDDTPPTITIGALKGPSGGTYTAAITLSENSSDFTLEDLTLINASATLSGSGIAYTATLTPAEDGEIKLSVAAGTFTDAAGNANIASNEVGAIFDATPPTVRITGEPGSLAATTGFTVTVTFSESVTGFEPSDIVATNANVTGLSGSGAVYSATLMASGTGDVGLFVPANSAVDASGNGNLVSNTVSIADITVERTQELIAGYMQTRANQLVRNQPNLIPFMSGSGGNAFNVNVTRGRGIFDLSTDPKRPIWMQANGSWTTDGASQSRYAFGAIGSHQTINKNLLLGAMLQFDHLERETGRASVSGIGWMVGPYFVAKAPSQPLYFEGRLLYGETRNDISPFGTYEDSFETTRILAQLKIAGELEYGETTLSPFLDASYTTDDQKSYVDGLGNAIPGQSVDLGQIEIGLDFSRTVDVSSGTLELWGGASGIWSHTSGSGFASTVTPDYEGGRGRVELGFNHAFSANRRFSASTFYDGIGAGGFESYGLSLGYEMNF